MPESEDFVAISRSDLAFHAGVGRAAVSNWESRYEEFPRPVSISGREAFDAAKVAAWLDGRRIPSNTLRDGEPEGLDYGTRFRISLGRNSAANEERQSVDRGTDSIEKIALWLVGQINPSPSDFLWLAFLVCLRGLFYSSWSEIRQSATYAADRDLAEIALQKLRKELPHLRNSDLPSLSTEGIDSRPFGYLIDLVDETFSRAEAAYPSTSERPIAASIFVYLMELYSQRSGKSSGDFFTPRAVVRLAVDSIADTATVSPLVYDPFCRAGEFLDEAFTRLSDNRGDVVRAVGHSPNPAVRTLAEINLALHGTEPSIDDAPWWRERSRPEFDYVLTNPPFNMALPDHVVHSRSWLYGPPPAQNGNFAWLQHAISSLGAKGRAAVVMTNNAGFTRNSHDYAIRSGMVEDGAVEGIISLPPNLFSNTGIPVSVWLLRKPTGKPENVLFIEAKDLGIPLTRTQRTLSAETIEKLVETVRKWRRGDNVDHIGYARSVAAAELRDGEYQLAPSIYVEPRGSDRNPAKEQQEVADLLNDWHALGDRVRSVDGPVRSLSLPLAGVGSILPGSARINLGELCQLKAGPGGGRLRGQIQYTDGVQVALSRHLRWGKIQPDPASKVPEFVAQELSAYRLKAGDLVMSRTVEPGRVAIVDEEQDGWILSTGVVRLRVRDDTVLPAYLAHTLLSEGCHAWMLRHMAGTVVSAITLATLARLPIAVPSLEEQKRISAALEAIEEQSRVHAELASVTRSLRESLARSLFGAPDD